MDQISLKEHIDQRFVDSEKALNIALTATQRASDLALDAQKGVNATQNEFRGALKDQAGNFITRKEMEAIISKIDADIRTLELSKATLEGKASQASAYASMAVALVGLVIGIARFFF